MEFTERIVFIYWLFGFDDLGVFLAVVGISNRCAYSDLFLKYNSKSSNETEKKFHIKIDWAECNFHNFIINLPIVMNPLRFLSICVNNSTHSSTLSAIVRPKILCRAVRFKRPGPLPQLSYIFETILMRSIVGTLWLIKYKLHSKYSRKSISPHKSCNSEMIEISSWFWDRRNRWKNAPYQKYEKGRPW